jgi:hypothetical protein
VKGGASRAVLLRALGPAGGAAALKVVRETFAGQDAALRAAAMAALAEWPDATVAPDLLALAGTEREAAHLAHVARGLARQTALSAAATEAEKRSLYEAALKTGQNLRPTIVHLEQGQHLGTLSAIELLTGFIGNGKDVDQAIATAMSNFASRVDKAAKDDAVPVILALHRAAAKFGDGKMAKQVRDGAEALRLRCGIKALPANAGSQPTLP